MTTRSTEQRETAKGLLRHSRLAAASSSPKGGECAAAAARVYQDIVARLSPLIGADGVRALFARSARLATSEFPCFASLSSPADTRGMDEQSARLLECLRGQDESTATEATIVFFATFLDLLARFVGEGLTVKVLRGARPEPAGSTREEDEK